MLSLAEQRKDLGEVLDSPGGFVWWYADLLDAHGRGLVLIWSFGLPFLSGSREGHAARDRPSVCLALYEAGRPVCYVLQTYSPEEVTRRGLHVRMGESVFRLRSDAGFISLDASLDMPIAGGGRITGRVEASGPCCRSSQPLRPAHDHSWSPLLAATHGRACLRVDQQLFELCGRAYLDSNASRAPLHELGIRTWRWGRVALPGRELIYYLVEPSDESAPPIQLVLTATGDGALREHDARITWCRRRRNFYGLGFHVGLQLIADDLDVSLHFHSVVDEGPFYLRFLVEARDGAGNRGYGFAEQVAPAQVDLAWQRPFVRMRTHRTECSNSMWLPLFSGPARGRFKRLMDHWLPHRTAPESAT